MCLKNFFLYFYFIFLFRFTFAHPLPSTAAASFPLRPSNCSRRLPPIKRQRVGEGKEKGNGEQQKKNNKEGSDQAEV
jgi:hypothetical protein